MTLHVAPTAIDTSGAQSLVTGIRVTWDDIAMGYVAGSRNLTITDYGNFTALPAMVIKSGQQEGGIEETPYTIEMQNVAPFDRLVAGWSMAPVYVEVFECNPISPDLTARILYYGKVTRLRQNEAGSPQVIRFDVMGHRKMCDQVGLGVAATVTCPWVYGDKSCKLIPAELLVTIIDVMGNKCIVSQILPNAMGGYLKLKEMRIGIRNFSGTTLETRQPVPTDLIGQTMTMVEGCDKSLPVCQGYANEINYGGFGYGIPPYNPVFQTG